jgi:hypothetical protein
MLCNIKGNKVATYFLIPQRDLALNNWPPFYLRLN